MTLESTHRYQIRQQQTAKHIKTKDKTPTQNKAYGGEGGGGANPSENLVLSNRPCLLPVFAMDNTAAQRFDSTKFSEK